MALDRTRPDLVLLDLIAVDTPDCTESSLKTHISNLRYAGAGDCVEFVWGIGFKMAGEKLNEI